MQQLASISVPDQAVQYVSVPAGSVEPVQYSNLMPAVAQSLASVRPSAVQRPRAVATHPVIEYVPLNEIQQLTARNQGLRRQQLAIGGAGVYRGQQLDDPPAEAPPAAAPPVMPAAITPPTPQEIAMALQRIQVRLSYRGVVVVPCGIFCLNNSIPP